MNEPQQDQRHQELVTSFINPPQKIAAEVAKQVQHYKDPSIYRFDLRQAPPIFQNNAIDQWDERLCLVQAYTNHGKSTICDIFLHHAAKNCAENEIVVKVSYENTLQQDGTRRLANLLNCKVAAISENRLTEMQESGLNKAYQAIASSPIWWIGPNEKTARQFFTPPLADVMRLLTHLVEKQGKTIKMIVVDHFHAIPVKGGEYSEQRAFGNNVTQLTLFPAAFHCPVIVATQSARDAEKQDGLKVPQLHHLANTADLERAARNVLSLWIPLNSPGYTYGDAIDTKDGAVIVDENVMFFGIMKQKDNAPPPIKPGVLDWRGLTIRPYDFKSDKTEIRKQYKDD